MRKRYNVSLDEEKTEFVKAALHKSGMKFSNFLDATISEFYNNLKEIQSEVPKGVESMEAVQFLEALTGMIKRLKK